MGRRCYRGRRGPLRFGLEGCLATMKQYFQCLLRRGTSETTRWIEARAAKTGARVQVLPDNEMWDVAEVYRHGLPEDVLKETQRLNRNSLPSVQGIR